MNTINVIKYIKPNTINEITNSKKLLLIDIRKDINELTPPAIIADNNIFI